jgi:hypothetical protein
MDRQHPRYSRQRVLSKAAVNALTVSDGSVLAAGVRKRHG